MMSMSRRTAAMSCATCAVDPALRAHHDRLLAVETDPEEMVELFELAVTWGELDYAHAPLIGPAQWVGFAEEHHWVDADRALRIFSLAADIAARAVPSVRPARLAMLVG